MKKIIIAFFSAFLILLSNSLYAENRTLDGYGNNVDNPTWGVNSMPFFNFISPNVSIYSRMDYSSLGILDNAFIDGFTQPARPEIHGHTNVRVISNLLSQTDGAIPEPLNINDLASWWLFFIHTDTALALADRSNPAPIPVPVGDPAFDPDSEGGKFLEFNRMVTLATFGMSPIADTINIPSPWLDLDVVYHPMEINNRTLRTLENGKVHLQPAENGEMVLPTMGYLRDITNTPNAFPIGPGFLPDESPVALALFTLGTVPSTLLLREHNRVATILNDLPTKKKLKVGLPDPTTVTVQEYDEAIFQMTRKVVEAEYQAITYNELLPLIGIKLPPYSGYKSDVFPAMLVEFITGPFTLHTTLHALGQRLDKDGNSIVDGPIDNSADPMTSDSAYHNSLDAGIDPILRGQLVTVAEKHDLKLVEELRSINPQLPFLDFRLNDLQATHINRGRDRGLHDYNTTRLVLGLPAVTSFSEITSNIEIQNKLAQAYPMGVNTIDPIVGMLAEDRVGNTMFGETTIALFDKQFQILRDSDRFWHQNLMNNNKEFRKLLKMLGFKVMKKKGTWVLKRNIAGLISDNSSVGGKDDFIRVKQNTQAFKTVKPK
ncbi:hypothetical protein L3V83_00510 [Thiotrichales bacterium 19X7-9]|nr:hypothetical protein [Thiotrichales bacterium 19X7-9]